MPDSEALLSTLESLRSRGALGERDLTAAIAHAEQFVAALPETARRLLDLGSGGGLPGLVIAVRCPLLTVVLTDRRQRRADLLRLACMQLGIEQRVAVLTADVGALAEDRTMRQRFDAVTARSFGSPLWTLRSAAPFLIDGGSVIVSEPPKAEAGRWPEAEVSQLGFEPLPNAFPGVRCFRRRDGFT